MRLRMRTQNVCLSIRPLPGGVGLETLLPVTLDLYHNGHLSILEAVAKVTSAPANLLNLKAGRARNRRARRLYGV